MGSLLALSSIPPLFTTTIPGSTISLLPEFSIPIFSTHMPQFSCMAPRWAIQLLKFSRIREQESSTFLYSASIVSTQLTDCLFSDT